MLRSFLLLLWVHVLSAVAVMGQAVAVQETGKTSGDQQSTTEIDSPPIPVVVAKKGSPSIDGKVDEVWSGVEKVRVDRPVEDLMLIEKSQAATATVKLLWDETHLYALWVVRDTKLSLDHNDDWQQDSVELFLDRNLKRTVFYQYDDAQYRVNYEGKVSGQGEGYVFDDIQGAAAKTDSGYVVEMSILIPGKVMEPGYKMGIELQVNDHRGGQGREAVMKWNHVEDDSWEDTSNFGIVEIR